MKLKLNLYNSYMTKLLLILKIAVPVIFFFSASISGQVDGTSGLPLGGVGTGAVKYNSGSGSFSANFRSPTRNGDYQTLANAQFQVYTKRGSSILTSQKLTAQQNSGHVDDDAVFPLHKVNFGELNGISIGMTAYIPFNPESIADMCHPSAMFEFSVGNTLSDSADVSIAFQINMPAVPSAITDTGFSAGSSALQLSLIGSFPGGNGTLSYGSDNGFFSTGVCNNLITVTLNRLALKVSLEGLETRILRFVLGWYKPDDITHYQYSNFWNSARSAAVSALNNFDNFKMKSEELVNRMRASNLPSWLVDQTLNSLVNLVNNSVYFQDGRYCHTEGMWEPEGTMDQMWHARQIYTMINPDLAWNELEWWARTQHSINYTGQIHHDFGINFNYVTWDNTEHSDYRTIYEWVDLNCGFIISVYEAFIATGDQTKLSYFWPYVKKAAQRILDQLNLYGSTQYPYTFSTSFSTYDAGGNSQAYNTGLSVVSYKIMTYLAEIFNEQQTITLYQDALQQAVTGFEDRWLDNPYPQGNFCESVLGGLWITNFLKMEPFWEKGKLDNLFMTIVNYYNPLSNGMGLFGGSYTEWQPYLVGHLGGYSLQTNRPGIWQALQIDMYERNYLNRNLVFNQQLGIPSKVSSPSWIASSTAGTNQYISIPVLWRNYYNIVGYHRNEYSDELWLEPRLFEALNHQIQNAPIFTPGGYAEISYNSYGDSYQNQEISFKPDYPMDVSAIYVWDLYYDSLNSIDFVKVNGIDADFLRMGSGDQTQIKINWSGTIPVGGITIQVEGEPKPGSSVPSAPQNLEGNAINPSQILLKWNPSVNASGYIIEVKIGQTFQTVSQTASSDTFYLDTGLLRSSEYTYRVRSFNDQGFSEPSEEIVLFTKDGGNGEVINALNAGGSTYQSSGIQYIGDAASGWVSGGTTYSNSNPIDGTTDDILYQTERYGDFNYSIPMQNGQYDIVLKFAEIYHDLSNARIFHVDIEGTRYIYNLDLYLRTGKNKAYDVVIPVSLNDGTLNINFITVTDNAKLSALEIRRTVVGINENIQTNIPEAFFLNQNYPNPFNPVTRIRYALPEGSSVKIAVYNILGELTAVLVEEWKSPGFHSVDFNAAEYPGGIYFYKITAGGYQSVKKMVLLK